MKIHHLTSDEAFHSLGSGPNGLTAAEAHRRLLEFGPNRIEKARRESLAIQFAREFIHLFALLLWVAAGLAFWADRQSPSQGMATLGWAIVGVIVVNSLFSFAQVYRAERALAALEKRLPHQITVLRNGAFALRPVADIVPGDVVALEAGDLVPADCRLIEAFGVRVNNATVTGESSPLARDAQPGREESILLSPNILLAGTTMVSGDAQAVVFATGMNTEFGRIAHLTQATEAVSFPLQRELALLSRIVAALATGLGVVFFLIGRAIGLPFWANFLFAIGIIVANVPEGLLPTVTLALAMGAQRMARRNVLVRHLPSVETLGAATVICTDKTGTLTENRMRAHSVFLAGRTYQVETGKAADLAGSFRPFFEVALLCQNLKETGGEGGRNYLGDPMEVALVEMATGAISCELDHPRLDEVPFDSDRKRLSTLHRTPRGLALYTKGALEALLPLCDRMQFATGVRALTPEGREQLTQAQEAMAGEGLRVLALAYRDVAEDYDRTRLEENLILAGLVGLEDPPRAEVPGAIRRCQRAGIRVIMITGDHPETARAVARRIGLVRSDQPVVITGERLRHLTDTQLQLVLDSPEILFARVAADQKQRIVRALKRKRETVAVTGDGVNDAPALKHADIGIAMGVTGTDVAREAADVVLADDNFASIVAAVEEGRAVFANVQKFLTYILTHNVAELVPYLAFALFKIPLALTILQILAVDLGTDVLPALALGAERPEPDVMHRPPRSGREHLVGWPLLTRVYLFLGPLEAVGAMAAFFFVLMQGGWVYGQDLPLHDLLYLRATTACLTAIVLIQGVNVFLCRSERRPAFAQGLLSNRLILLGIGVELVLLLLIAYTPWGNALFGTAPISWRAWLFVLPFAAGMLLLEEARKWLTRRRRRFDRPAAPASPDSRRRSRAAVS
jgi:calcium-translocating P-type ATPase